MDNPELFSRSNFIAANKQTKIWLQQYLPYVKWRPKGDDLILDIGCGSGEVTANMLLPMLPTTIKKVIATDVNSKMIDFAQDIHSHIPKIEFHVLDISDKQMPDTFKERFDHIFSFFCFHWIQDQGLLLRNVYDMLKPGGDLMFWMVASCPMLADSYIDMSKDPKWKKYTSNVYDVLPPYWNEKKAELVMQKNLEKAGFAAKICTTVLQHIPFPEQRLYSDFLESINPFVKDMSIDVKEEYMKCLMERVQNYSANGKNIYSCNVLIVYATKP